MFFLCEKCKEIFFPFFYDKKNGTLLDFRENHIGCTVLVDQCLGRKLTHANHYSILTIRKIFFFFLNILISVCFFLMKTKDNSFFKCTQWYTRHRQRKNIVYVVNITFILLHAFINKMDRPANETTEKISPKLMMVFFLKFSLHFTRKYYFSSRSFVLF